MAPLLTTPMTPTPPPPLLLLLLPLLLLLLFAVLGITGSEGGTNFNGTVGNCMGKWCCGGGIGVSGSTICGGG